MLSNLYLRLREAMARAQEREEGQGMVEYALILEHQQRPEPVGSAVAAVGRCRETGTVLLRLTGVP
jgi:hypothetical protein